MVNSMLYFNTIFFENILTNFVKPNILADAIQYKVSSISIFKAPVVSQMVRLHTSLYTSNQSEEPPSKL